MNKVLVAIAAVILLCGVSYFFFPQPMENTSSGLSEIEARAIAEKSCIKGGEALAVGTYDAAAQTWWFDANLNAARPGCVPGCVVSETTKTADVNWRCADSGVPKQ